MHPIVQICGLVLLSAAAGANSLRRQEPGKIADISPYKWAIQDWVPEKNRRTDDRSMPIGAGELEPIPQKNKRRMHKRQPKRKALQKSRKQNPHHVKDVLKRHYLKSYQNVMSKFHSDLAKKQRRSLGYQSSGLNKNVPLFPKDYLKENDPRKFQVSNGEVKEQSLYKEGVYLPVYNQVLENLKSYKKQLKAESRRKMEWNLEKQQKEVAKKLGL